MISVRVAEAGDAQALALAHVEAWRVGYRGLFPDDYLDHPDFRTGRLSGWQRRLRDGPPPDTADPENVIFAGLFDERIVGFGHVGCESMDGAHGAGIDRGEVYGFYVHPDAWGSGVADALMHACHDELARRFDTAVLWVLRDNPRARRFYERHGWTGGAGDDVIESPWLGSRMAGLPTPPPPVTMVQYRRAMR